MKKQFLRILTVMIAFMAFAPGVRAQEVVWDASFDFFFDNREYKSQINWPQTLFGARIAPELGIRWQQRHSLMMGVDLLANFGSKPFEGKGNEIFAYYQYMSPKFRAAAGVVPRRKVMGDYSGAFFSDSVKYFDPNLTGLLLQYVGGRGYVEFACDWNSMITNETREKFILFSAGQVNTRNKLFNIGYHLDMYHHAGTYDEDGVVDNVLVYPFVGTNLTPIVPLDTLTVRVGWLNAFQNDRKYVGEYVTPGGVQIEVRIEKWKFGIFNTLYIGDNLMPYFIASQPGLDYGPGLYWGEPFYRTNNMYDRLELYWQPIRNKIMSLKVASVHHYDGSRWGWQQKILFSVNLGQRRMFKQK